MRPLFIIGTGGHSSDLATIAEVCGYRPVFVAKDAETLAGWGGIDEVILEEQAFRHTTEHFALGIGDNRRRAKIADSLRGGLRFPTLIHPDSSLGRNSRTQAGGANGTMVFAGARFTSNVRVSDFVIINLNATVSHDVELGFASSIAPGASIAGNVCVGEGAAIGLGAAVNQGEAGRKLQIGAWTTVGSGAVVTGDCDPDSVYVGVPARKIR